MTRKSYIGIGMFLLLLICLSTIKLMRDHQIIKQLKRETAIVNELLNEMGKRKS